MGKLAENHSVESYLRSLDRLLRHVPVEARRDLVEDIAAHIDEGRERGRNDREILAALGSPQAVAAPYLDDLMQDGNSPRMRTIRRVLGIVALVTGLFAAIVSRSSDSTIVDMAFGPVDLQGLSSNYGYSDIFAAIQLLIFLALALMVAASAVMRPVIARKYSIAAAIVMTIVVIFCGTGLGMFFVPSMVTAWMLAGANNLKLSQDRRAKRSRTIQLIGAAALLIPVLFALGGLATGAVEGGGAYAYAAIGLLCGVGFLLRYRLALWATSVVGAGLAVLSIIDQGMLMAAFWLGGITYFYFGLYGLLWFEKRNAAG